MPAPESIRQLVEHFKQNEQSYRSGKFNEAELRLEFLNPFFEALGWDVSNRSGYAEAYKDVVVEPSLDVEGELKAPDYAFRIGGTRKFFVEAKKPSVNIKTDIHPAFQLRRYAWSAKLALGILTDFEEFAVYDCRSKPNPTDKAGAGRVMYLRYTDYVEQWDEIAGIFSREAVLKGSFDQYAQGVTGKHGTQEVDDAFLKEIEDWRELLAHNLATRNATLSVPELNYAVQMTIDRIIFLRICEDRGIEQNNQLQQLLKQDDIYKRLCELFRKADTRYNSGLFHFEKEKRQSSSPDGLSLGLAIDDKPLKEIIKSLYFPCPYVFSVIPTEILGQVYERFLGKVIRLTAGHQARVEEKPEVRKAGGVYYTPTYIVEYIVKNTVGKLLEGKTPREAAELKIVDPACGSGSFLLGAYQYILDWHTQWYSENNPLKWAKGASPRIYQAQSTALRQAQGTNTEKAQGEWKLTTAEKKRILLDNIHGVDIDAQAVEVTKMSLSLKVLEGESQESIGQQLGLFKERALPDLGRNIQCGNSLIGSDYYNDRQLELGMEDEEERSRVNAFDWQSAFPQVFARGGFDAVIGNPPYVRAESLNKNFINYAKKYKSFYGNADLYVYFIEKSHQLLNKGGIFGFICSNKFIKANYGKHLRKFLNENTSIRQIIDFGELPVFKESSTFPAIIITKNEKTKNQKFIVASIKSLKFSSLESEVKVIKTELGNSALLEGNWILHDLEKLDLIKKIDNNGIQLRKFLETKINYGIKTALDEAFIIEQELNYEFICKNPDSIEHLKPYIIGDDVRKYRINYKQRYLILFKKGWTKQRFGLLNENIAWKKLCENYPLITSHLQKFRESAIMRRDKGDYWWELRGCNYYDLLENPKIVWPEIAKESRFAYDNNGYFINKTCFFTPTNDLYLIGILNSKLIWFYLKEICSVLGDPEKGGRLMQQKIYIEKIPIHQINFSNQEEKSHYDKIVSLVKNLLVINKKTPRTPWDKEVLRKEIESDEKQIDSLVYELYGLTEEEIKIIEPSN